MGQPLSLYCMPFFNSINHYFYLFIYLSFFSNLILFLLFFCVRYDVTDRASFANVRYTWKWDIEKYCVDRLVILIGHKCDRKDRAIATRDGECLAKGN